MPKNLKLPKIVSDYLDKDPFLQDQYDIHSEDISDSLADPEKFNCNRELLVRVIQNQYDSSGISFSGKVSENIESLQSKDTFTVVTGHQLNIFTGPLFSIYKILTTIRLAEDLSTSDKKKNVVPVFWMASEDHDLDEIDHVAVKDKEYKWISVRGNATGRMETGDLERVAVTIGSDFPELGGSELLEMMRAAYASSANLADATRKIMHGLFGRYGLVIIDADTAMLKGEFENEIRREVFEQVTLSSMQGSDERLSSRYKLQVSPRPVNLFLFKNQNRYRISPHENGNDQWKLIGTDDVINAQTMNQYISDEIGNFSPNVILRTVYQQKILPNIAYIGGPGELSYWLQFKPVFDKFNIIFPVLVMRNSLVVIPRTLRRKIDKLGLDDRDLLADEDEVQKKMISDRYEVPDKDEWSKFINEFFSDLKTKVSQVDRSLEATVEGEKRKMEKSLAAIHAKIIKALKRKNEEQNEQLRSIRNYVMPGNVIQERAMNILTVQADFEGDLIEFLYRHTDPSNPELRVIDI